ncbi:MAG: uracil-DNA glycosylase [Candidatus Fermentibacter sp.]|nr:uracil-DNA glycosylase [Candidatus Fermentibacter sp.]
MDPLWAAIGSFGIETVHLPAGRRPSGWDPANGPAKAAGGDTPAPVRGSGRTAVENGPSALDGMAGVRERLGSCEACRLSKTRNSIVFGEGNPCSGVLVVGEGPGASEDETGRPFVGRAGQLLDRILASVGLDRECCYIANVVKCRPPANRVPSQDEADACAWVLDAQIEAIGPGVILALGATAMARLLGLKCPLGQARAAVHDYRGIPVVVTYHPAALLRTEALKRPVWDDMKKLRRLMDEAGLPRRTGIDAG